MTTKITNNHKPGFKRFLKNLSSGLLGITLCAAATNSADAQTPYFLSAGDFTENFDDIADTTAWPDGFPSAGPWAAVAVNATGEIPSATRITNSTATFLAGTSSSAGVQRGEGSIYLLSTGGNPGNTSSVAVDLLLSFTNRNAGTLSFDAATVFNGATTSNREGELKVFYTKDDEVWTEISGGGLPYTAINYVAGSRLISVALPAELNEAASVRFRFYYYNKATPTPTTVTGSRPKISIDNLMVTSTSAGPDNTAPELVSLSPENGADAVEITSPLTIDFSEPVMAGAGNVTLYASSQPSTPLETFPASAGTFSNTSVSFTPSPAFAYETSYFVIVDADAFMDAASNPFTGIPSGQWSFTTMAEPPPIPPFIVRLSPESNGAPAIAGDVTLEIEYDQDVIRGDGTLEVFDLFGDGLTPVASYDISSDTDVTVAGAVVSFVIPFTAEVDGSYYVQAPQGLLRAAVGDVGSEAIGLGGNDVQWFFDVVAPDTASPFVIATSPQNRAGASVSADLVATFDEPVTIAPGPWSIEVFDITAGEVFETFTEESAIGVLAGGNQLFLTLSSGLEFNNAYRVTLSAGVVADAAGNLSQEVTGSTWEFTTGGPFVRGQVVISQVYGGGGNSGASFRNDFIELHNTSDAPISLSGWSVQYAASARTSWQVTPLTGTIQPGGYFLIQQAAGTGGTEDLPAPDVIGTIAMAAGSAKVALVNSVTPLTGSSPVADPSVSDFVGYGAADAFEGSGAAPLLSATLAAIREVAGSQDSDNNAADFVAGTPAPRNSSSPPYFPGADGSGTAIASNATTGAGSLVATPIFPSMASGQEVKIDLTGSFPEATISGIEIDVPSDFGAPLTENISLSGTGLGGGSVTASGQTVSITGASLTETTTLFVVISGLSAPDLSADPDDVGNRTFAVRTASDGGTLTGIVSSPSVRVAMPVADLATLRAVTLPSPKAYLIPNEVVVTYVEENSFRNQHYIQDATAGILIDDPSVALGASYLRGDGLLNLVGSLNVFHGLLQFTPVAATAAVSSTGNAPAPIPLTLAELTANPLTYQSRLVRVNGVAFQDATGNFTNNSVHVLTQDADTFAFRTFFDAEHSGTAIPTGNLDLIGILRTLTDTSAALSPRSLADFTTGDPEPEPGYLDWAALYAGGGAANEDFDNDGVPNGVEYFFGVNTPGFTPTPGIVNGQITFPRDASLTDVSFTVQTSDDLVGWDDVLVENLDLSDPNSITYVLPDAPAPFFVRIRVTVAPPAVP